MTYAVIYYVATLLNMASITYLKRSHETFNAVAAMCVTPFPAILAAFTIVQEYPNVFYPLT